MRPRSLATAVVFLTRVPVRADVDPEDGLRDATAWFPLVGAGVGVAAAIMFGGAHAVWGPGPAAVLAVVTAVAVTGAFHEDGLADAFDGLWGGWDPERRLAIMRDSRLGTYGAAALVLSLGLRVSLLAGLTPLDAARALVVSHTVGRATVLPLVRWYPAARHSGQGARVADPARGWGLLTAALTVLVVGAAAIGAWVIPAMAVGTAAAWAMAGIADRRLGGITGDVLGAANQMAHLAVLGLLAALADQDRLGGPGLWNGL